jgi:acetyltransferase-like isoleucine patch superfamily enzyme
MKRLLKKILNLVDRNKHYTRDFVDRKYKNNIGKYTYGEPIIYDWNDGSTLTVGNYTSITNGVVIMLGGGGHNPGFVSTYPFPSAPKIWGSHKEYKIKNGSVKIGNDVWIGYGVIILPGVSIGDGAVIGAGSVVAKDIPPYSVVVGNPAKVIKKRFSDKEIKKLLEVKWWDWQEEKIKENVRHLHSKNLSAISDSRRK